MKKQKVGTVVTILIAFVVFCIMVAAYLFVGSQKPNTPEPNGTEKTLEPTKETTPNDQERVTEIVNAATLYQNDQLSSEARKLLSNFNWPKLRPYKSVDTKRQIYLVDCKVTNNNLGVELTGVPEEIPNVPNVAETSLKRLTELHFGGFPNKEEIQFYEKNTGRIFKNKDAGINGVALKKDGVLVVNFYDSVAAYGGGSSRVGCMYWATEFTAKQFPTIKKVQTCIDKYQNCAMDFQP
jgi:hypothetical protein